MCASRRASVEEDADFVVFSSFCSVLRPAECLRHVGAAEHEKHARSQRFKAISEAYETLSNGAQQRASPSRRLACALPARALACASRRNVSKVIMSVPADAKRRTYDLSSRYGIGGTTSQGRGQQSYQQHPYYTGRQYTYAGRASQQQYRQQGYARRGAFCCAHVLTVSSVHAC